jgi:hypothetical protein
MGRHAQDKTMKFEDALTQTAAGELTVLELGRDTSLVQRMAGQEMRVHKEFALGVDSLARLCLIHEPPWPIELERAIELTEEAVMPLAAQFAGTTGLILQGFGATLIANTLLASGISLPVPTLDEVEDLFNRLVAVSQGRPASQEKLPTDGRFFGAMLILREFMHHLHFAEVTLQPNTPNIQI